VRDWKKSFRKLPAKLSAKLGEINSPDVKVLAGKRISRAALDSGEYEHLGLTSKTLSVGQRWEVVPLEEIGTRSKRNQHGWEIIRDDLPKYTKYFYHDIAIYGDAARNGWTTAAIPRKVYERDFTPPYLFHIEVYVSEQFPDGTFGIVFSIDEVFSKLSSSFDDDFLFAVNLLQENTGVSGVVPSSDPEFVFTSELDWKIFPPGSIDEVVRELSQAENSAHSPDPNEIRERLLLFDQFEPTEYIRGLGGNDHYIGAKFADDLVAFENLKYGNALYVLYEDWKELAKKSRRELLKLSSKKYDRIVHTEGWQTRFAALITDELKKRGKHIRIGRNRRRKK
tara:strand:- start:830 stop:1843 length:1014 start_codon:yes stop_codon:yes gene_type:complete